MSTIVGSLTKNSDATSSTYRGPPNRGPYEASKAALGMIAIQKYIEFGSTILKVFAVCPESVHSNLRGQSEDARSGWGKDKDPEDSGEAILNVIQWEQDADAGKFVHEDGVYLWWGGVIL
jgi:NAD(P)-dependent dehydrogenase (short-subunit alcohol dehydrogenase family)